MSITVPTVVLLVPMLLACVAFCLAVIWLFDVTSMWVLSRWRKVVIERDSLDGGFIAYRPSMPGVMSQGNTPIEAVIRFEMAMKAAAVVGEHNRLGPAVITPERAAALDEIWKDES